MPLPNALTVKHCRTYQGLPLVHFTNLPGPDPELTPAQVRALAESLLAVATEAEALAPCITDKRPVVLRNYSVGG